MPLAVRGLTGPMTTPRGTGPSGNQVAREVFAGLPPRYDRLAWLLSFGQDRRWRRAVVERVAAGRPRLVLDVATGPAGVALAVARRTGATVVGVDLDEPMLRRGAANVRAAGRSAEVLLVAGRAERLPFPDGAFDAVSFSYLLRYVDDPAAGVARAGALRAAGRDAGEPGVLRAAGRRLARRLAVLRVRGAAAGRWAGRRPGVVAGGPVPVREHPVPLPALPARLARPRLGAGGPARRRVPADEPRRRPGDVGDQGGRSRDPGGGPAGLLRERPPAPAGCATG